MTIQRFDPVRVHEFQKTASGCWVTYTDHLADKAAALAEKDAALTRERECRWKLVEALENASVVLYQHRTDGHGNPLCGWDFAVTMANINAALLAAKEME